MRPAQASRNRLSDDYRETASSPAGRYFAQDLIWDRLQARGRRRGTTGKADAKRLVATNGERRAARSGPSASIPYPRLFDDTGS
ncbi:hypothetical protein D9M70_637930 [compost metagenome]